MLCGMKLGTLISKKYGGSEIVFPRTFFEIGLSLDFVNKTNKTFSIRGRQYFVSEFRVLHVINLLKYWLPLTLH